MNAVQDRTRTEQKGLIADVQAVERAANALIEANARLRERGHGDAQFTAIPGGEPYLANWKVWVQKNLGVDW